MNIRTAIQDFLMNCEANNPSPATLKWYTSILFAFHNSHSKYTLEDIRPNDMRRYIVSLKNKNRRYVNAAQKPAQQGGYSDATIAAHVRALHAFWKWATEEYQLDRNPMKTIKRYKLKKAMPKGISPHDFVKLLESTTPDAMGKRDRAILCFLADTGCRLGGLLSLTLDQLDLIHRRAIVSEKGGKLRVVMFTPYTQRMLNTWLSVRRSESEYVFTSMTHLEPLTTSGVNQLLKRLKEKSGVRGRVNPHAFRHNFARAYLQNGGDVVTLGRLLGHADISTTADFYAIFSNDELAAFHEKFSPLHDWED